MVLSSSQALIATLDNPNLQSSIETSAGTMDLQTSKAAPSAGYAFSVGGIDVNFQPMVMGGVFNIDAPNTISGNGNVADQDPGIKDLLFLVGRKIVTPIQSLV